MKTSSTKNVTAMQRGHRHPGRQSGMGATIILFTIALIVLVGAALAYATRGNGKGVTVQSGRVYSGLVLKQSADYRDAYSRFIFDGGVASTMTFNSTNLTTDLFNTTAQYGSYQAPPVQAMSATAGTPAWLYNSTMVVTGVGTAAADSIVYVSDVSLALCTEVNRQMYNSTTIPLSSGVTNLAYMSTTGTLDTNATVGGRSTGCFQTVDLKYVLYTTLNEA